jgi:hypothetical protein
MNDISEFVLDDNKPLERGALVLLAEPLKEKEEEEGVELTEVIEKNEEKEEEYEQVDLVSPRQLEEEKEQLRFASRKAYRVGCLETLSDFKRVTTKEMMKHHWRCISRPTDPFMLFEFITTGQHPHGGAGQYMLKAKLPAKLPIDRVIRMCIDFDGNTRTRWDTDFTHVQVLEDFPEDCTRVVQWTMRKPPLAILSYPPSGISVVHWNTEARYVLSTSLPAHRLVQTPLENPVDGWAAFYISPQNMLVAVFSMQCKGMPGYAAYYTTVLQERITILENACSKYNYYYT